MLFFGYSLIVIFSSAFFFCEKKKQKKHCTKEIVARVLYSCRKNAFTRSGTCLSLRLTAILRVLRNYNRQCLQQSVTRSKGEAFTAWVAKSKHCQRPAVERSLRASQAALVACECKHSPISLHKLSLALFP